MTRATMLLAIACLSLTACAADRTPYPSLAPRAAERIGFAEPVATPAPAVTADPALDADVARSLAQLAAIGRSFDEAAAAAMREATAARGQPAGSERWIEAQIRLATLDDLRAQTSAIVTDLDQSTIARGAALAAAYPALEAAQARAEALLAAQTERIAAIGGSLAPS